MTPLEKLEALATNLWWSWHTEAQDLFHRLNPSDPSPSPFNPLLSLARARTQVFSDPGYIQDLEAVYEAFSTYMSAKPAPQAPRIGYFCMEYGLHESLPLYAGGLGVLAGDHLKAASDLGIPFTAVGLFLKNGYFDQHFDENGWQQETYPALDPKDHPLSCVEDGQGDPVTVTVHLGDEPLLLKAWKLDVGHTRLYLLDSDLDANPAHLRPLTHTLYRSDRTTRLQKEIILGIGGLRLLRALNIEVDVYHLNEGHCAFLLLELLRERLAAGDALPEAEAWTRRHCVFTTHTPVLAGHDRFQPDLFREQMSFFRSSILSDHDLLCYGRINPEDESESFTMTILGLKLSRQANGVSALNGEVARRQWHHLYPDRALEDVPIGHITNGIHLPTWSAPQAVAFIKRQSDNGSPKAAINWERIGIATDEALWAYRCMLRRRLIDFVYGQTRRQSMTQTPNLNPEALTICFARRFATYKRALLLFSDLERAIRLFSQAGCPLQMIYSGKAHPRDDGGKEFIHEIYSLSQHPAFQGKLIFLENYNMEIGRMLVSGCDVWLNNPRRPLEASGTSGQKVAVHGGLNLSILDGWWPEGYNGHNGWAIGREPTGEAEDPALQDREDALSLYERLEEEVIPMFYERDDRGLPLRWIARMRAAMQTLPLPFSARRMVTDYLHKMYRTPNPEAVAS